MNTIRAKIILFWILLLVWGGAIYLHHRSIAWWIYWIPLAIRYTKPKLPQLPRRLGYIVGFGFIVFLLLVLVDEFYPFPASVIAAGKIFGVLIVCPLIFYAVYLDCRAFRTNDASA